MSRNLWATAGGDQPRVSVDLTPAAVRALDAYASSSSAARNAGYLMTRAQMLAEALDVRR